LLVVKKQDCWVLDARAVNALTAMVIVYLRIINAKEISYRWPKK
jgi:hypothetical protein